ncbi:MAG: phenylalanine--tRNA ligase subunit alpha [Candidatus Omnitrophica bacterium]|nr:phenylalanine--tRNA ligase subunit alpha [Candidatus Omnitrophota bacterium]
MIEQLNNLKETAISQIKEAKNADDLEAVRIKYLGRKGEMAKVMGLISSLPDSEKPAAGRLINQVKPLLEEEISKKQKSFTLAEKQNPQSKKDLTMPGHRFESGHTHPITQTISDICAIFRHMGFAVVEGPEIETEHNNFEALNIPLNHPSRDAFDTFYIKNEFLLRSHTSPVQVRYMTKHKSPLAIIVPGKVFRPDAVDASHSFMFHQVEGLMVDERVSLAHLRGVLFEFCRQLFGEDIKLRFRPHFFPFTEPSAEVDVSCIICKGAGCSVCSQKGWLEILGAGMVNPKVFKAVGIDSEKYTGFAFGMGVERIAMLKYGINDIRLFFENDIRFLEQF